MRAVENKRFQKAEHMADYGWFILAFCEKNYNVVNPTQLIQCIFNIVTM